MAFPAITEETEAEIWAAYAREAEAYVLRNLGLKDNCTPSVFIAIDHCSFSLATMLHRRVSSPSFKIAAATIKSLGSAPSSPGLSHGVSPFNFHHQGSALASPLHSPRFLDFQPTAPQSPTITKSRLESHTISDFFNPSGLAEAPPPDTSRTAKVRLLICSCPFGNQPSTF